MKPIGDDTFQFPGWKQKRSVFRSLSSSKRPYGKKSSRIAPHVDAMYVTETGGHKVAPAPASTRLKKMVDYNKSINYQQQHHQQQQQQHHHHHHHRHEGGGDRGGGTHIAATVKNTMRRLLRRTKSHRDAPSTMTAVVANGHAVVPPPTRIPTSRNDTCNAPPPSSDVYFRRYSRPRARPQVRKNGNERSLF